MRLRLPVIAAACAAFLGWSFDSQLFQRGLDAFRQHNFQTAEREFTKAVREEPASAHAWKLLGMTYITEEKYESAEDPCRKACALDPHEDNACYYLGRVELTLGRFEAARRAYETALANGANRGRVLLGLALTYEAMLKPLDAERYYKLAIAAGESRAKVDYGLFLFKQGRGKESLEILRRAGANAELARVERALRQAGPVAEAPAGGRPVRFEASPLDMVVNNGATGSKHLIETMIAGVAVFDFDGDGWP
ncbi:MAG: tetratricopeptide repeat protein, partial [Bryobacteraceae bacterium]